MACPHFSLQEVPEKLIRIIIADLYNGSKEEIKAKKHEIEPQMRRYAGGRHLPKGRYYSLCNGESENDGGTLLAELEAYLSVKVCGIVELKDTFNKTDLGDIFRFSFQSNGIIFSFCYSERRHNQFVEFLSLARELADFSPFLTEFGANSTNFNPKTLIERAIDAEYDALHVFVPYACSTLRMDRILDLRRPETLGWVCSEFRSNFTGLDFDNINEIYTALTTARRGGNLLNEAIGLRAMQLGADGIIFPSARISNYVSFRDEKVVECYGWNFLDLRGVEPPFYVKTGASEHLEVQKQGIEFHRVSNEPASGDHGWLASGLSERRAVRIRGEFNNYINENENEVGYRLSQYASFFNCYILRKVPSVRTKLDKTLKKLGINGGIDHISLSHMHQILTYFTLDAEVIAGENSPGHHDFEGNDIKFPDLLMP